MDLVFAQEELRDPSGQKLQYTAQIYYQVQIVLDSAQDLRMIADRHSFYLFEYKEQFTGHIVEWIEDFVHEVGRALLVEIQQASSNPEKEKLRVGGVLDTAVYQFFETFSFGESQKVLDRVANPATIVEWIEQGGDEVLPGDALTFQRLDAVLELEEHVESDNHHFFQIWMRNLIVEEMFSHKPTKALPVRSLRERPDFRGLAIHFLVKLLITRQCTHERSK